MSLLTNLMLCGMIVLIVTFVVGLAAYIADVYRESRDPLMRGRWF